MGGDSALQDVKADGDIATYKRSIGEMNISPSVQGPYSRWSLVLDPATGLRGTLLWVTRDVLIYQGLHVVSAKYVDALSNNVVSC